MTDSYPLWRAANPDASHFAAYQAGYEAARAESTEAAMVHLMTKSQIAYVKSSTWRGESKRAMIKRLINIGIGVDKTRWLSDLPAPPKEQG